jgi:hypothetical protein
VATAESGTGSLLGAAMGPYRTAEQPLALDLLHCFGPGMLLLAYRKFLSWPLARAFLATGAHILWRFGVLHPEAGDSPARRHLSCGTEAAPQERLPRPDGAGHRKLAAGNLRSFSTRPLCLPSLTVGPGRTRPGRGGAPGLILGPAGHGERAGGQGGSVFAGVVLAVGQQVKAGIDDVGEQLRGSSAPVKAQRHLMSRRPDRAACRQPADLSSQREEDGWAITTSSRSPALPVSQVSSRPGRELQPGHVHLLHVPGDEIRHF